ncbi:hypothetical protein [Aquisalimonas sp.]|uniref:hypothetical protein n=1 Tax=Aquisalimonas sp. TaxID=1872621 RepID=UPI0025BF882D|nr:hypothetical protein [Aquisalimonas sp.]
MSLYKTCGPSTLAFLGLASLGLASTTLHAEDTATLSGFINGYECASVGTTCPVDGADPRISIQSAFVIQQPDGEYYLLTGVPRDVEVRHVNKNVRVTGTLQEQYNAFRVDEFHVRTDDGDYETVWSEEMAQEEREQLEQMRRARHMGG